MQQLKCISRVSYMAFIHQNKPDRASTILAWLFEKTIDLVDGIIQLHKANLDECSQALIRILFETYLKYIHFANLMISTSTEEASTFVIDSIYLMRAKGASQQAKITPDINFPEQFHDLNQLELKHQSNLKKIKKHGFLLSSIEAIACKYDKIAEYQIMYRNFSRNVHVNDFNEYFLKQGNFEAGNYIEERNHAAFSLVLEIFIEMMTHMNIALDLSMEEELIKIKDEYSRME
jgi:hypothetical protein